MKKVILSIIGMMLILLCNTVYCSNEGNAKKPTGTSSLSGSVVTIHCSPDLYNLATVWAAGFGRQNSGIRINVIRNGEAISEINGREGLFLFPDEALSSLKDNGEWRMIVGRDVIVPVINSKNTLMKEIREKGVSPEDLAGFFRDPVPQWGAILNNHEGAALHYYGTEENTINSTIAAFTGLNNLSFTGTRVASGKDVINSVQKDPAGFGFCRMRDILTADGKSMVENIALLPIDKNGNGRLDNFENIYRDQNSFMHGVWVGKYPASLCRSIYSLAAVQPSGEAEVAFLTWILNDGQEYLNQNGYSDLSTSESATKSALLANAIPIEGTANAGHPFRTAVMIIIGLFIAGIAVTIILRLPGSKKAGSPATDFSAQDAFNENSVVVPKGLYFDKSHTWAFMEHDGNVRIGIDDFLQHVTGPVTRVKMKNPGEKIKKGEKIFSVIQNGKQLMVHSPVSGTIRACNELLSENSSAINVAPYTDGWVYLIEPANWIRETQFMIMSERYSEWLNYEFTRLKDFFSVSLMANNLEYAQVVLQDGGEMKDNILADFGPEVWEDFQTQFIDSIK